MAIWAIYSPGERAWTGRLHVCTEPVVEHDDGGPLCEGVQAQFRPRGPRCVRATGIIGKGGAEEESGGLLGFLGADARNRTEDPIITSRPRPCLGREPSLHTGPYSAIISTVSDGHVGKIVGKEGGRLT